MAGMVSSMIGSKDWSAYGHGTPKNVWKPPAIQPQITTDRATPQTVADEMMSGAAFDPYRKSLREQQAQAEKTKRADVARQINVSGMGSQGFGKQLSRQSEADIMRDRYLNELNTEIAEQQIREEGAQLGLNIMEVEELVAENKRQADIAKEKIASGERIAASEVGLGYAGLASESDYRNKLLENEARRIALEEKLGTGELGLSRDELALRETLGLGELELSKEDLALRRMLGTGELDLSEQDLALRRELGLGELGLSAEDLALRRELGLGELELGGRDIDLRRTLGLGELGLGYGQLDLATREQSSTEKYQNRMLDYQYLDLSSNDRYRMGTLARDFKELDLRDKEIMANIDLGYEKLNQTDRQLMAQIGLSQQAQDWLEEFQSMDLKIKDEYQSEILELQKTDPVRGVQELQYERIDELMGNQTWSPNYGYFTPA